MQIAGSIGDLVEEGVCVPVGSRSERVCARGGGVGLCYQKGQSLRQKDCLKAMGAEGITGEFQQRQHAPSELGVVRAG